MEEITVKRLLERVYKYELSDGPPESCVVAEVKKAAGGSIPLIRPKCTISSVIRRLEVQVGTIQVIYCEGPPSSCPANIPPRAPAPLRSSHLHSN